MEGTNMYDKILVPLDGSAVSEQVLPYVRPLAKALVASADPSSTNSQEQALDYLKSISASLNDLRVSISSVVRQGSPVSWRI
jgi:nucleotide-binding universal stress UspA family protein